MNVVRRNPCMRRNSLYVRCSRYCTQRTNDLATAFNPEEIERGWYDLWEENEYFTPKHNSGEPFKMILPPPNVTGVLHLGHTLTATIQDVLARWHRMQNHPVIWLPGLDHAGIATQVVVEKYLQKTKGVSRHDLGREQFLSSVWEWKDRKGDTIKEQLKATGASLDWSREFFTMNKNHSNAVTEAFVRLSEHNMLYRDKSLVNWSPALRSAISDIEVDHLKVTERTELDVPGYESKIPFGQMIQFAYQLRDTDEELIVASTRPETMLGDVAIAVHPEDERYTRYIGSHVWHPFRKTFIPVIADSFVSMEFGTGAVKISPAHDRTDFEVAKKHKLGIVNVIDEHGKMTSNAGPFQDLPRFLAREKVLAELATRGALKGVKDHEMLVPKCSRSGDIIEYLLKDQWFVRCNTMADLALQAVKDGTLKIDPPVHKQTWYNWLENIRDWCVSRQLWWGHRIPAYFCNDGSESTWIVARTQTEAHRIAQEKFGPHVEIRQDEDVLDTWFSSALLPFSTMGWPDETKDFQKYYPLTMMETGHDILFFWVARMVMLGVELTGQLPFKEVLLHGVLCDAQGRKMSKSIGNVISPENVTNGISLENLNVQAQQSYEAGILTSNELERTVATNSKMFTNGIPACGTDALRLTLCSHNIKNHNINFDIDECFTQKLFCNKIWQASKFTLLACKKNSPELMKSTNSNTSIIDLWILSRLSVMVKTVNDALSRRDFHVAVASMKQFLYNEFCDVYVEATKPGLKSVGSEIAHGHTRTLTQCLEVSLRLLAPITPYLADELYSKLSNELPSFLKLPSLLEAPYPTTEEFQNFRDVSLEDRVDNIWKIVQSIRSLWSAVETNSKPEVHIVVSETEDIDLYVTHLRIIAALSRVEKVKVINEISYVKEINSVCDTVGTSCAVFLIFKDERQLENVGSKMDKKKLFIEKELNKLIKITSAPGYIAKAPENVRKSHLEKVKSLQQELHKLEKMSLKCK